MIRVESRKISILKKKNLNKKFPKTKDMKNIRILIFSLKVIELTANPIDWDQVRVS